MNEIYIGSSGTLIGSSLESIGYYYQSFVLDSLTAPFTSSIGAMIYMIGAMVAVVQYVVMGRYKMGMWFLLGPGLFFACILPRTETTGAEWRANGEERSEEVKNVQVRDTIEGRVPEGEKARVSVLFAEYNKLISKSVNEFARIINSGRYDADLKLLLRAELFSQMHIHNITDPDFDELVQHAFLRDCREVLEAGREATDFNNSGEDKEAWKIRFESLRQTTRVKLSNSSINYLANLKAAYPRLWNEEVVKRKLDSGSTTKIESFLKNLETKDQSNTAISDQEWAERVAKAKSELSANNVYNCDQIWNFTYVGLVRFAKQIVDETRRRGEKAGINGDDLITDLANAMNLQSGVTNLTIIEKTNVLYKIIAQYVLRNSVNDNSISSFVNDYAERATVVNPIAPLGEGQMSFIERARVEMREWQEKTNFMTTASQLPYYQGIGLYLLAVLFPFFALLLLIPGKHAGFLLWFFIWLWLKSWDIGFAIVMVLDEILFSLMAEGVRSAPEMQLSPDFAMAFYSLKEIDPTFQLGTYYSIMAVVISSVPIVTSYLVLGGLKGGSGMISSGKQLISGGVDSLSGKMKEGAQNAQQQQKITGIRLENRKMELDKATLYQRNINQGLPMSAGTDGNPQTDNNNNLERGVPLAGNTPAQMDALAKNAQIAAGVSGGIFNKNPIGQVSGSVAGTAAKLRDADLSRIAQWGYADAINSKAYQRLFATGRVYGMYEIALAEGPAISQELKMSMEELKGAEALFRTGLGLGSFSSPKKAARRAGNLGQFATGAAGAAAIGAASSYASGGSGYRAAEAARGDMSFGSVSDGEVSSRSHFYEPINFGDGEPHGRSREGSDIGASRRLEVKEKVKKIAREEGLNIDQQAIFLATIDQESGFNPDAANKKSSSVGLGGFRDSTGAAYGLTDTNRFDLEDNARALAKHMKKETLPFAEKKSGNFAEIATWSYAYHHDGPNLKSNGDGFKTGKEKVAAKAEAYRRELQGQVEPQIATDVGRSRKTDGT